MILGSYLSQNDELKGLKLFGKIDYNINKYHSLTLRHSYTKAEHFDRLSSRANRINFSNNVIYFPRVTNSTALEIKSRFGNNSSNNLIIGYTKVRDDRDALGSDFPYVTIEDGSGSNTIHFGTEEFSTANRLDQDIFTLTNNFKLYKGNHTITLGTHNECYDMFNSFIPQNFGSYRFKSIADFRNEKAFEYRRSYSLVDDVTGDDSKAAAALKAMQLGFYAQDEIKISTKLNVTAGLRVDLPIILDDPKEDTYLNTTALPKIATYYPIAKDVKAGKSPDGQVMFSQD
ncbi:MAG: TonB-dependent receptor [Saprospiraceae bacterium]|nr:TonB-dependent receptor [Saprospiraceae bacterium]